MRQDGTTTKQSPPNDLTVVLLTGMLVVHNAQQMNVIPVFGALRERYGIDHAGVGTLFAAYVLGYAIFQTVIGIFGDRFDPRRLLLTGLALSALWSALFALVGDFHLALILRFLLGATSALLYTPAMSLGILLFDRAQRGRVIGTIQVGAGVGMGAPWSSCRSCCHERGSLPAFSPCPQSRCSCSRSPRDSARQRPRASARRD